MVGPARKREAVKHVEGVLEVLERRACRTTRQPRSTQRYRGRKRGQDAVLAAELRGVSAACPRAGYRMATALLRWTFGAVLFVTPRASRKRLRNFTQI